MELNKVLKKRASVRKYSSAKVRAEDVIACIQAANLAPSPGNLSLLTFVVVDDKELKEKISEACQQEFIADAPFLVVVCSSNNKSRIMYEERADNYLKQHAGAAIENFLLEATNLGLVSCWIGAFSDMIVKDILDIPEDIEIEAILPVAYESKLSSVKQKSKSSLENRVYFNKYRNKFFKKPFEIKSNYL